MSISSIDSQARSLATLAARQTAQVSRAAGEAKETAVEEAHESRQVQEAEGEVGRNVNTYA
jgi:hypothetical protein